jgi:Fe-S-cluster-containing hydrogenase component 2
MTNPLQSLQQGNWFKLICGASFQHLPSVRSLCIAYTLAGADCIDVAADPAVIKATKEGIKIATELGTEAKKRGFNYQGPPLLMVSLNDGQDPHFRKAEFNSNQCPSDCPQPCIGICPAEAIAFNDQIAGIIDDKCYGCGRCLPICPSNIIFTRSYVYTSEAIADIISNKDIDAIEIHTQIGHLEDFKRLWENIKNSIHHLKILAISCTEAEGVSAYLQQLYEIISPLPCKLIWQTDGRPMSGDIGAGTTHTAIKLGQKVLSAQIPGYVQLAGGTNNYTVDKLKSSNLLNTGEQKHYISGIAYGSYARVLLSPILEQLDKINLEVVNHENYSSPKYLEDRPDLLWETVNIANSLVSQIKTAVKPSH